SSISGVLAQLRRTGVDFTMGGVLLAGGVVGSALGVWVFDIMTRLGQIDLFVQLSYVIFLGLIGAMMFQESVRSLLRSRKPGGPPIRRAHVHSWVHGLPFKMKFRASGLYISVIPPALIGAAVGFLSAIMGVGGGFILVPAMIYILRMPAGVVVGTSLFQIIITTSLTGVLQAGRNQTVDIVLATLLLVGGVLGAQLGAKASSRFRAEELRALLALIVLLVGLRMGLGLFFTPDEPFVLMTGMG
ncbi:sulfite exporter TauE/SafE family protein, partial [Phenylobacterium sp.]|uniref:sulfite exporter TauE/SafE family protein n=1 Tax=Phenylobacterium sp. TaxID=1871053 RepID=UPI0027372D2F